MSTVRVRAIRATDGAQLERFYSRLSAESRRRRFLSISPGVSRAQCVSFCSPDHDHDEGFVAVVDDADAGERIVGHLCLEPDGTDASEVAIAVADEFQHLGIGRQLMAAGLGWARRRNVTRFTATMLSGNGPIHRLLIGLGLPSDVRYIGSGVASITIDLDAQSIAA
jgi:GNAT superfamily N-acetyltransferase